AVPRLARPPAPPPAPHAALPERLHLPGAKHLVASVDGPNTTYRIEPKASARSQLLNFITTEHPGDAGIVYCLSRRGVDQLAEALAARGITALPSHAGLPAEVRAENQAR